MEPVTRLLASFILILTAAAAQETPVKLAYTCDDDDSGPVYLELTGADATLARTFVTGNFHSTDATLASILLSTDDGGKTWIEPTPRQPHASLEQIQFIDFETGWVSGANVQGVPRDPFLLLTSDGGKTWTQSNLFEEPRTGVVERFRFDSKTDGALLVATKARHELYETHTGGTSWTLLQTSGQPLKLPRERPAAESALRVRADAKTKSYQVEKRQEGKWIPLGAFLVEVAKCSN